MSSEKPIIVIVPGAFHAARNYRYISEPLRSQGYEVLTPPLAVTGENITPDLDQYDDASLLLAELVPKLDEGKEAILVSHSYGSLVVAAAIEGQTVTERASKGLKGGVKRVVNIAGFAFPVRGKSVLGDDTQFPPMPYHVLTVSETRNPKLPWIKNRRRS